MTESPVSAAPSSKPAPQDAPVSPGADGRVADCRGRLGAERRVSGPGRRGLRPDRGGAHLGRRRRMGRACGACHRGNGRAGSRRGGPGCGRTRPRRPRSLPRLGRIVGRHARTGEAQGPRGCRGASTRRSAGTGRCPGAAADPRQCSGAGSCPTFDAGTAFPARSGSGRESWGSQESQAAEGPTQQQGARQQPAQQQTAPQQRPAAAGAAVRTPCGPPNQPGQPGQPAVASAQPAAGGSVEMFRRASPEIMNELQSVKKFLWMTVQPNASVTGYDGRSLTVSFAHQGAMTAFTRSQDNVNLLAQCIHKVLGVQCQIVVTAGGSAPAGGSGPKAERRPGPADTPSVAPRPAEPAAAVAPAATAPAEPAPAGAAPSAAGSPMPGLSAPAPSGPVPSMPASSMPGSSMSGSPVAAPSTVPPVAPDAAPHRAAPAAPSPTAADSDDGCRAGCSRRATRPRPPHRPVNAR